MNYEETLSTLKAIQASYSPTPFLVDSDTEPRFVIDSDERTIEIPDEFKFLAVKMDHMSERIYFEIPRYFDGEDLATKICVVQYINANKEEAVEGVASVTDVDYSSVIGKIIFRWDVDNNVTKYAGDVSFSVCFYTISDDNRFTYSWNTVPATLPVLDTLDNTGANITENYPTELILWQYRMTELDRTISEKIEEATASIDADTKAAQAARKGAEDAESRVNAIVAGNEAYTKQQSHDLFALALRGSAEAAKSITIYPDKGSNVVATFNGFTKQEGSGDASPVNQRPIVNGGLHLMELNLWELSWTRSQAANGLWRYRAAVPNIKLELSSSKKDNPLFCTAYKKVTAENTWFGTEGISAAAERAIFIFDKRFQNDTVVTNLVNYLTENKVKAWVTPSDKIYATGLYASADLAGEKETGQCAELTAPLCQGDKLITKVKSGCDMRVTLDGGTSDGFVYVDQGASGNMRRMRVTIPGVLDYNKGGFGFSDWVSYKVGYDNTEELFYCTIDGVFLFLAAESLAAAKQILSQRPLTMWLRSTSYTEVADIAVSLETHQQEVLVLDGTEAFSLAASPANLFQMYSLVNGKNFTEVCDRYKNGGKQWNSMPDFSILNSGRILGFRDSRFSTEEDFKAELAAQHAAGTPVTIVYQLATPITYAHDPIDFIASPDEEGAWVITGEADGTVSAEYNKNITKALEDILTRVSALELHALGG